MSIPDIRSATRALRRSLPEAERRQKSSAIARRLARHPRFQSTTDIGLYWAMAEEVDTQPIIKLCKARGKRLWLPVINSSSYRRPPLLFRQFVPGITRVKPNRFGIPEPTGKKGTGQTGDSLDLVLVPLVAFNETCDRIGMGAGYYDRTFPRDRLPLSTALLGLAFECQKAAFTPQRHDTPLHGIITEGRTYTRSPGSLPKHQ